MSITKAVAALANLTKDEARRVYAQDVIRRRLNSTNFGAIGFEPVECGPDAVMTGDGREIIRVGGRAYALRPEVHAELLAQRFAEAQQRREEQVEKESETKSVVGTESLSSMVCPKCGDSLQHTSVCPKCAAGKLGYRHRYTCVCGGVDLISKEIL